MDAFSVPEILEWGENRYQGMRAQALGEAPLDETVFDRSTGEQEQLIAIIRSIVRDERKMFSVNVPNRGAVPGLPDDAALEIPGVATARGLRPVAVPDLSAPLTAILARRLTSVYLAVEAAMTGSRDLAVEAMIADGAVTDPERRRSAHRRPDRRTETLPPRLLGVTSPCASPVIARPTAGSSPGSSKGTPSSRSRRSPPRTWPTPSVT